MRFEEYKQKRELIDQVLIDKIEEGKIGNFLKNAGDHALKPVDPQKYYLTGKPVNTVKAAMRLALSSGVGAKELVKNLLTAIYDLGVSPVRAVNKAVSVYNSDTPISTALESHNHSKVFFT